MKTDCLTVEFQCCVGNSLFRIVEKCAKQQHLTFDHSVCREVTLLGEVTTVVQH